MRRYPCTVVRVADGDSLTVAVELGLGVVLCSVHCRLLGLDTPELAATDPELRARALQAAQRLRQLLPVGSSCEIETDGREEKYGRLLVTVWPDGCPVSANEALLAEGLARPYDGGKR